MAAFIVERHHDIWDVSDKDGEIASFGFDHTIEQWWICANTDRFPTADSLPSIFDRSVHHYVGRFGDCFRFFGLPLPRVGSAAPAPALASEAA